MRKNIFCKTLSVALAGAVAAGTLAGCGNDAASTTAAATEKQTEAEKETKAEEKTDAADGETKAESEETKADGGESTNTTAEWEPFAENVTIKIPVYDRGQEGVPNVSDNYWTKWIQENFGDKYNITVNFEPITRTDVMTEYSLLASSEDLPTLLMEFDYPKVAQWANDGYLTTFNMDDFAAIAPTYYNRMVELNQLQYTTLNDETYFVLAERPNYDTAYSYQTFVRMDWLEQVGYDHVPMTREEYVDAMTKIQEAGICEHPGGGEKLGVGADQNDGFRSLPMDETEWAMYGDFNIPALGWEPNKKLIKNANEDFNLGITDPEYYITDKETAKANFINGKSYSYGDYIAADMPTLTSFYEQNPDAKLAIIPRDSTYNGENPIWRADNPFGMIIGFSSQASEDEIKAGMMYLEWMNQEDNLFTMQWGIEGENFNYNEEGLPESVADYSGEYKQGYSNSSDYWSCVVTGRAVGTIEQQVAAMFPQDLPQSEELQAQIVEYYNTAVELAGEGHAVSPCLFSTALDAETDNLTGLQELYVQLRDELTMCAPEEFDAKYEEAVQEYLDAGYQDVIDQRKEAYEAGQSTKLKDNQK